ncbi:hypothetical protein C5748_18295 [Phyllobacterium phragmitis]|uniref:Uncharacterized protein n=1 Tax=Phyllobacterium phragmitis TaxID=2670329 RepID=A0A2S9INJ9_9HYPH|nr:hypothetical protein [Phyllobacterium phragmitis]PRD42103.1 hypothetical protein C5748_18295 [Phyllobacterium phragmitis]
MNKFSGYIIETPMGYRAMLRFAHEARPAPLLGPGGNPIVFPTKCEAWESVTKNLLAYFNSPMRRDGVTISAATSAADALFPSLIRQKGASRTTHVERRRAKA